MKKFTLSLIVLVFLFGCSDGVETSNTTVLSALKAFNAVNGQTVLEQGFQLNTNEAKLENVGENKVLFIPTSLDSDNAKVRSEEDFLIASFLNSKNEIVNTVVLSSESSLDVLSESFTGVAKVEMLGFPENSVEVTFNSGKIMQVVTSSDFNAKTNQDHPTLYCIGKKFEDNCCGVEEILGCYAGFGFCFIYRAIDCAFFDKKKS